MLWYLDLVVKIGVDCLLVFVGGFNLVIVENLIDLIVVWLVNSGIIIDGNLVWVEVGVVFDDVVVRVIE